VRNRGSATASHPDARGLHASLEIPAASMLLQEGVEGGEQGGHGREPSTVELERYPPLPYRPPLPIERDEEPLAHEVRAREHLVER
jgi:hypothetical protein